MISFSRSVVNDQCSTSLGRGISAFGYERWSRARARGGVLDGVPSRLADFVPPIRCIFFRSEIRRQVRSSAFIIDESRSLEFRVSNSGRLANMKLLPYSKGSLEVSDMLEVSVMILQLMAVCRVRVTPEHVVFSVSSRQGAINTVVLRRGSI